MPRPLAAGLVAAVFLGGCVTEPSSSKSHENAGPAVDAASTPAAANAPALDPKLDPAKNPRAIAKGMTADEVLRRLGEPAEKRPMTTPAGQAEVWVYRRKVGTVRRQTATDIEEIPYVDIATGQVRTVPQPKYSMETIDVEEDTSLLIFDGKLIEWKQMTADSRRFH